MQVTVSSRNTDVSDALRTATTQKIERLGRLVPGANRAEVHFCEEQNPRIEDREVCEVVLHGAGERAPPGARVAVGRHDLVVLEDVVGHGQALLGLAVGMAKQRSASDPSA